MSAIGSVNNGEGEHHFSIFIFILFFRFHHCRLRCITDIATFKGIYYYQHTKHIRYIILIHSRIGINFLTIRPWNTESESASSGRLPYQAYRLLWTQVMGYSKAFVNNRDSFAYKRNWLNQRCLLLIDLVCVCFFFWFYISSPLHHCVDTAIRLIFYPLQTPTHSK